MPTIVGYYVKLISSWTISGKEHEDKVCEQFVQYEALSPHFIHWCKTKLQLVNRTLKELLHR